MNLRALVSFAFFASFTSAALASDIGTERVLQKRDEARGVTEYLTLHFEGSRWILDRFQRPDGEYQRHVSHRGFASLAEAEQALAHLQSRFHELNPAELPSNDLEDSNVALVKPPRSDQKLWEVTQEWNWEWEKTYEAWVEKTINPKFFQKYKIATDCADVIYATRWIFARVHHLPAVNHLSGSNDLFTQDDFLPEWRKLKRSENWWEDQPFLAAIDYLLDNTYTHALLRDSYPIALKPEALRAGAYHLQIFDDTGHTFLIQQTHYGPHAGSPLVLLFSGVPRAVREIWTSGYWLPAQPKAGVSGFVRMLWPVRSGAHSWKLTRAESMKYYSLEQYDPSLMKGRLGFWEAVILRVDPQIDYYGLEGQAITDLEDLFYTREEVVNEGYEICRHEDCAPGTGNWENWSTPARDKRIGDMVSVLELLSQRAGRPGKTQLEESLADDLFAVEGTHYLLGDLMKIWKQGGFSSDPRVTPRKRWGEVPKR